MSHPTSALILNTSALNTLFFAGVEQMKAYSFVGDGDEDKIKNPPHQKSILS